MLVFEAKRVKLEGGAAVAVMRFDHLPAAAGIAADRVDCDGVIARQDAGVDERPDQRNRPGRVAAGVGDLARGSDALGLALRHLGEAIGPIGIDAVRRAAVEQLGHGVAEFVGHRGRLARGVVGEAQDHEIDLGHHVAARLRVLAICRRQAFQRDRIERLEAGADAEPGGAGFAVDKDAGLVGRHLSLLSINKNPASRSAGFRSFACWIAGQRGSIKPLRPAVLAQ